MDVTTDRATALERLDDFHRQARSELGFGERRFVTAEQVHGKEVAVLAEDKELPAGVLPDTDGLVTNRADVCLGIYVADCAPVFLVDAIRGVIGLVHSGRKGTELGIVPAAVEKMVERFGSRPAELVAQIGPCIRPPWYEVDFAAGIVDQCRAAGVGRVEDCRACTAAAPEVYYSYRREKGRTGRMLALLALAPKQN